MKKFARPLEEMVRELPIERQAEVRDFVEFLLAKQSRVRAASRSSIGREHLKTCVMTTRRLAFSIKSRDYAARSARTSDNNLSYNPCHE